LSDIIAARESIATVTPVSFQGDRIHYANALDSRNLLIVIHTSSPRELP